MAITDAQLNKALKAQTEEMAAKFTEAAAALGESVKKTIETTIEPMKSLADLVGKTGAVVERLKRCLKKLTENVEKQKIAIQIASEESKNLKIAVESLEKKLETEEIRARIRNLVVHGVEEDAEETRPALQKEICQLLNKHYGMVDVSIELLYRLPTKNPSKGKPVLVSFLRKSDRDSILYRKRPLGCPITVKADLPRETAAKRQILGRLTRWEEDQNKKVKRTDHFVEVDGARFNHLEAQDFLKAFPDYRPSDSPQPEDSFMSDG